MSGLLYGGIEAGGTKFICAISDDPPRILREVQFETTTPQETLERVCNFFSPYVRGGTFKSIGLASFGPIDIDRNSITYGYITSTPKPNWENTDILGRLQSSLGVPVAFHHDVSCSAIGESKWGASKGIDPSLYLTVGTGIGGGFIINGKPLSGLSILEMGHIRVPHDLNKDPFPGSCPYHQDCFEGLASGPAIEKRLGKKGDLLSEDDPFWDIEAEYIAHALANYIYTLSPRIIVIGGGVMQRTFLYQAIREKVCRIINNYLRFDVLSDLIDQYIVPPKLGKYSGVLGAIALAMEVNHRSENP